jgi:outer membrane protein assembly factor BamB
MKGRRNRFIGILPLLTALVALAAIGLWWSWHPEAGFKLRLPGSDAAPGGESGGANPVLAGKLLPGAGQPADLPGAWPQFRGLNRDGISPDAANLSRDWNTAAPRELWAVDVGEGYAGAAVRNGRVYLLDYDRDHKQSALRCLSLADGREIWRFAYPLTLKRNHGMTRTVPVVTDRLVVALDSKCNVLCLEAATGALRWSLSLARDFGATVPQWYAGQCPLVDGDKVILAPGGRDALLLAVDVETGRPLWQTPNPRDWKMTHSSVQPMDMAGRRLYVYCASGGVVGVDAGTGQLLWETSDWKISIATVPSPLPLDEDRVFLTGGYNAGSLMLQLTTNASLTRPSATLSPSAGARGDADSNPQPVSISCRQVFRLAPGVFGATQHTPILKNGHLYGVRADGQFVCLDLSGKVAWASGPARTFGLGSFLMAGGLIYALNDSGKLSLLEASPARFNLLGEAQVLKDHESWGPMAIAGGRLVARDLTHVVCLDVAAK